MILYFEIMCNEYFFTLSICVLFTNVNFLKIYMYILFNTIITIFVIDIIQEISANFYLNFYKRKICQQFVSHLN